MPKKLELTNQKFGRLTARRSFKKEGQSKYFWDCDCDCGNKIEVSVGDLKSGHTKSCGCLNQEKRIQRKLTHGKSNTPEHRIWAGIKTRCYNPNSKSFKDYGAKGIIMCDRWLNSFEAFYADMGERPSPKHSIDRFDTAGSYSPENCRWATSLEQANNKSNNRYLTYNGKTQTVSQWAKELNLKNRIIEKRLDDLGWSVDQALSTEPGFNKTLSKDLHCYRGKCQSLDDWAAELNIHRNTLWNRVNRGWTLEKALTTPVQSRKEGI